MPRLLFGHVKRAVIGCHSLASVQRIITGNFVAAFEYTIKDITALAGQVKPQPVCSQLLIFHRNQQFATHRLAASRLDSAGNPNRSSTNLGSEAKSSVRCSMYSVFAHREMISKGTRGPVTLVVHLWRRHMIVKAAEVVSGNEQDGAVPLGAVHDLIDDRERAKHAVA